ncbi:MAG TPA: HAD-IIA family hydrolase [Trebonia sp.]|nr:HAD-IIA family hydrolase [Trebonia sp.]
MRSSDQPLCRGYDVALLDLDGVVYIGGKAVAGAREALKQAQRAGMRLAYVTNNASRTPAAVAQILTGMDMPAQPSDVVTSAQAAARLLAERLPAGAPVLVIGGMGLRVALRERGLRPVSTAAAQPAAVVEGFAPQVDYSALAQGGLAVRAGALFVGTNADSTLPSPRGIAPGNGSLLQVIAHATGTKPVIAGKPETPLHRESVIRTGARHPLGIGDRLDTDIEAAHRAGTDSLLVLTGVSRPADAVLAPPSQRPTYIAETLDALLQPYPAVTRTSDGAACGGWTALRTGAGPLALKGTGTAIDGLRALAAAAWDSGERLSRDRVDAALGELAAAGLAI